MYVLQVKTDLEESLSIPKTQLGWLDTALLLPYALMQVGSVDTQCINDFFTNIFWYDSIKFFRYIVSHKWENFIIVILAESIQKSYIAFLTPFHAIILCLWIFLHSFHSKICITWPLCVMFPWWQMLLGPLGDRFGPRRTFGTCLLLSAISMVR